MKLFLVTICTLIATASFGFEQSHIEQIPVTVRKTGETINDSLSENESVYIFNFNGLSDKDSGAVVKYLIDGVSAQKSMSQAKLEFKTTPGKHVFQFSIITNNIDLTYPSIYSDSLEIASQIEASYSVLVTSVQTITVIKPIAVEIKTEAVLCKPVIYLYPEERTETTIELDIKGHTPFYYPSYKDNWSVTAHPNGDLEIADETYRYLFWESIDVDYLTNIEVNEGFVVEGSNTISFLEEKLTAFGFTASERADFITYWGPKMTSNDHNLVRFEWNEQCNQFAELSITPTPDHLYRLYIFIAPLDNEMDIQPQVLPTMDRSGFTVLEWGGQTSIYQPNTAL